jgi:hypothetical protein
MAEHINRWNDHEDINLWLYNTELMKQFAIWSSMKSLKIVKVLGDRFSFIRTLPATC